MAYPAADHPGRTYHPHSRNDGTDTTNFKRLLSFHAVSQVGYMILGIAIATPLGVAAGLFHMINNALYKSGLFLTAGSIAKQTGHEDIDKLGGLSKAMPLTFIAAL